MNKERLVIKNFGPIKSIDLELGKMTILIGEQATGKSTIAKVLAVCRYFSYLNDYSYFGNTLDSFKLGLNDFGIGEYFKKESQIIYENNDYKVSVFNTIRETNFDENGIQTVDIEDCTSKVEPKSEKYKDLLETLEKIKPWYKSNKKFDNSVEENLYKFGEINDSWLNWYPSDNFFEFDVKNVMDNPLFLPIERTLQAISFNEDLLLSKATQRQIRKINRIYQARGVQDLPFNFINLVYKRENNINYIRKKEEENFYPLANSASGYQSITPITLGIKYYSDFRKKTKTFIIEEPEINLFPKTQKKLIEFFVENVNINEHSFLLPTHSPYILSSINDLLMAYKRGQKFEEKVINLGYRKEIWLNPKDLSVYQLLSNGTAESIINEEINLIKNNIIDDFSDELNDNFDDLLDLD